MFSADAALFVLDCGEAVTWVSNPAPVKPSGLMIFDLPDTDLSSGEIISADYEVTFETAAWPGLMRDEQLQIGGTGRGLTYKLRTNPQRKADGVFSAAKLTRLA